MVTQRMAQGELMHSQIALPANVFHNYEQVRETVVGMLTASLGNVGVCAFSVSEPERGEMADPVTGEIMLVYLVDAIGEREDN